MNRSPCIRLLSIMAVILACGVALGQEFTADIDYPVPAMPFDGWVPAWYTIRNNTGSKQTYDVKSSQYWGSGRARVEAQVTVKARDQVRGLMYVYAPNRDSGSSSLVTVYWNDRGQSSGALRLGRSVIALTSKRGTVSAHIEQLDKILGKFNPDQSQRGTEVVIEEHKDASRLPDSWLGYDLLQAMVIEDFPYGELSTAQEEAIIRWVEGGGTLLVFPGKLGQALQSSLLRQLVSIQTQGAETLAAAPPELEKVSGSVTRWNFTIEGAQHLPWAEVAACGAGRVAVFKYDFLGSLAQWDGFGPLLQRTCTIIVPRPAPLSPPTVDWASQEDKLLKPPTVAAILGIYLLVLGPVNYIVLRRRNKLVLMPLSITGIAIAFTIAIIIFGYLWKGSSNELKESGVIRTLPDRTTAYAASQIGLYCSSNRKFELDFPASAGVRKTSDDGNQGRYDDQPLIITDTGQGTYRAGFTSMMWSPFRLDVHAPLPQFGNLRVENQDGALAVVNATTTDVDSCWVRKQTPGGDASYTWYKIGRVPRGGRAVLATPSPTAPPYDVLPLVGSAKGTIVIAKSASRNSAIPYKLRTGRAHVMQCDTFITGGAK